MACRAAWLENLPMLHHLYSVVNPVSVKSLMAAFGLPAGPLRRPLRGLDAPSLDAGLAIAAQLGLDERYGYTLKPKLSAAG